MCTEALVNETHGSDATIMGLAMLCGDGCAIMAASTSSMTPYLRSLIFPPSFSSSGLPITVNYIRNIPEFGYTFFRIFKDYEKEKYI